MKEIEVASELAREMSPEEYWRYIDWLMWGDCDTNRRRRDAANKRIDFEKRRGE